MAVPDLHLAVAIGPWWVTAAYSHAGAVHPLYFDGHAHLPSGVWRDPQTAALITGPAALDAGLADPEDGYRPDPMTLLHTAAAGDIDPAAAVGVVLAHVANIAAAQSATPVTALTVVTGQIWGVRARRRLHEAATNTGLPEPHITTVAAAAAAFIAPPAADQPGHFTIVGTADLDLTILDRENDLQQLAHGSVHDPAADSIDHRLIAVAAQHTSGVADLPTGWQALREIRQARADLATRPRTSLLLPEPCPAAILDRSDVTSAAAPHLATLADSVKRLLADADLEASDIDTVVLCGTDAILPDLAAGLRDTGLPEAVIVRDPHAIPTGALRLTQPLTAGLPDTAATMRLPRTRLTLAGFARIAALATCSAALLFQTIYTAMTWKLGGSITGVRLQVENLGLAAALAALTAWAVAQLTPTTWAFAASTDDEATTGALLRRGYFGAATLGLALAGLWGLATGVSVGWTEDSYLKTALAAAAPIAASAALIAITAPRIPAAALTGWLRRADPPVTAITLASVGVYLQWAAMSSTFPANLTGMYGTIKISGAALLGVATALTVTRLPLLRIITAVVLGSGYALVTDVTTTGYLTIAYIAVLAWWAVTTAAAAIRTITPNTADHLARLLNAPK